MTSHIVQYVIVRRDLITVLGWPIGAVIAQACHATTAVNHLFSAEEDTQQYLSDVDHMHKIVVGIDGESKLKELSNKLQENGVNHKLWIEQPEDIATCLATRPYHKEVVQKYFKKLKLFNVEKAPDSNS